MGVAETQEDSDEDTMDLEYAWSSLMEQGVLVSGVRLGTTLHESLMELWKRKYTRCKTILVKNAQCDAKWWYMGEKSRGG